MSEPAEMWQQVADNFERHHGSISDDQWDAATPCTEWTVRDLVGHAVGVQAFFGGGLGSTAGADADWSTIKSSMETALSAPDALEGNAVLPGLGTMPKQQVIGIAIGDLLIHSWDLARALGRDEQLPAEAVEATLAGLKSMPEAFLRDSGRFGPAVSVAEGASAQEQLLGYAGRQP
jgi:uncharacterized protein (TIGR03086 family)